MPRRLADLQDAIYRGAVKRVRHKAMTGGVATSTVMELAVYPPLFYAWGSLNR
jgi:Cu/Ag efflux pump CusA